MAFLKIQVFENKISTRKHFQILIKFREIKIFVLILLKFENFNVYYSLDKCYFTILQRISYFK